MTKSYKKKKEEKMRKEASKAAHTWNLLFVSANSATDAMAKDLGVEKKRLLDADADNLAVRVALTETAVVNQTKKWLQKEGIRVSAFDREGASLLGSTTQQERSKDTIIVKHLPADAEA